MIDIQNQRDYRNLDIQKVGVKRVRLPITVLDKKNGHQQTVATINMYVNLPRHFKGTHMSRFLEILHRHCNAMNVSTFSQILDEMKKKLAAESAHVEVEFPYFVEKRAPVTGAKGLMEYRCRFICSSTKGESEKDFRVEITAPITTLCPCSKEISRFGAHNQRSEVKVTLKFRRFFWIEDIIGLMENCASSQVYSVLKRPDEKYVTEHAYQNPMFVEDVVRAIAEELRDKDEFDWFSVEAENFESIHNHNAYAYLEYHRDSDGEGS